MRRNKSHFPYQPHPMRATRGLRSANSCAYPARVNENAMAALACKNSRRFMRRGLLVTSKYEYVSVGAGLQKARCSQLLPPVEDRFVGALALLEDYRKSKGAKSTR